MGVKIVAFRVLSCLLRTTPSGEQLAYAHWESLRLVGAGDIYQQLTRRSKQQFSSDEMRLITPEVIRQSSSHEGVLYFRLEFPLIMS